MLFWKGEYAFKIPVLTNGWELFLCGLLGNIQERKFHKCDPVFCPIVFSFPLGLLNVMRRAEELNQIEFDAFINDNFLNQHSVVNPMRN